ncbi:MAG: sugar ABC transporter ATP-binding protein [Planctomycetes bacterium]|nr:sugar ABC transporter ATP-binding protein [Planctomycetota bacterium]
MSSSAPASANTQPLLTMRQMVKSFPGVRALRGVDLTLYAGEVLALLGENGAGKSTLMKLLGGAHLPDSGTIALNGKEIDLHSPQAARQAGVAVIYQEFNLVPGLTACENIFLGQETTRTGVLDLRGERLRAAELFRRLGVEINLDLPCRRLTTAQQQLVEIAKALSLDARIIVMDEPTAALTSHETECLFDIIRELRRDGIGIIYISHRLDEIFTIADRVSILRDGANVDERPIGQITRNELIERMVGRELKDEFPSRVRTIGSPCLEVSGLCRQQAVRDVSFTVHRGEILGLTGLVGAGRTEAIRLIFGADRRDAGTIRRDGRVINIRHPRDAIAAGIGLLTEDRKLQGLVLGASVRENFGLPNLGRLSRCGFVQQRQESTEFAQYVDLLKIRIPHQEQPVRNLSGGNQQKVVLAKWLARNCDLLIFDEPTRGVDVGAKYEIYLLMNQLVAAGKAIVMISSELPEVLGMADRILVMHTGRVTGEIADARQATQEQIMHLAVG